MRDKETDRLPQGRRHRFGRVAITGFHVDLDAGVKPSWRPRCAALESQNRRRRNGVDMKLIHIERMDHAVGIIVADRNHLAQRNGEKRQAPARGPGIACEPPGLRNQGAAGLRLHLHARGCDQRRDQVVIVVVFDAQEQSGFGQRNGFARRSVKENSRHGWFLSCPGRDAA
jgi:hypothetical protein